MIYIFSICGGAANWENIYHLCILLVFHETSHALIGWSLVGVSVNQGTSGFKHSVGYFYYFCRWVSQCCTLIIHVSERSKNCRAQFRHCDINGAGCSPNMPFSLSVVWLCLVIKSCSLRLWIVGGWGRAEGGGETCEHPPHDAMPARATSVPVQSVSFLRSSNLFTFTSVTLLYFLWAIQRSWLSPRQ
jgi:hypothetical protein